MKVLGIDEAGRGPVIGPMIICGYLVDSSKMDKLKKLGVRDSKLLSPTSRAKLHNKLKDISDDYAVIKITAERLNEMMKRKNLNKIEIDTMAKIIDAMKPDVVVIDSPEVNTKKFAEKIRSKIVSNPKIIAENYADKKYPVVSAASIIAKVTRDDEIKKIERDLGMEIGSGYPGDERTRKALETMVKKGLTNYIRKKWITYKRIQNNNLQSTLKRFDSDEQIN